MASVDRFRLPPFEELPQPEQFDEIDRVARLADERGIVSPLPTSREEVKDEPEIPARVSTLRTRLYLMGYLGKDNGLPVMDARVRKAIRDFQRDAATSIDDFEVDGWVGDQTWTALQELVSFEDPSNLDRWFVGHEPGPALWRAVEVRLNVLGLLDARHPRKPGKTLAALQRFTVAAELYGLTDAPVEAAATLPTLAALFDQDTIAARLAGADGIDLDRAAAVGPKQARRIARRFLHCAAKIELWLLGYELLPDGRPKLQGAFRGALMAFWTDAGKTPAEAERLAGSIDGAFFERLLESGQETSDETDDASVERLYDTLADAKPAARKAVWKQIKTIGSRIWDGIKRAWRWFKALIKRGIRKVKAWARNLARLVYRYAAGVFGVVKRVATRAIGAVTYMLRLTVPGSSAEQIVIRRDADFDYRVFVNRAHDADKVNAVLDEFSHQADLFVIILRLFGILLDAVMGTMRRGFLGWLGFVLALVKLRGTLRELGRVLRDLERTGRGLQPANRRP